MAAHYLSECKSVYTFRKATVLSDISIPDISLEMRTEIFKDVQKPCTGPYSQVTEPGLEPGAITSTKQMLLVIMLHCFQQMPYKNSVFDPSIACLGIYPKGNMQEDVCSSHTHAHTPTPTHTPRLNK